MADLDDVQRRSQQQFDKQSANYGKQHILADTSDVAEVYAQVKSLEPRRALDVAAGAGHTGLFLAEQGWQVTLADLAKGMLQQCEVAAKERGLTVTLKQHAAEELPYPDGSFELVSCRVAAHHFSDPAAFVREAARGLVQGGSLLIIDGSIFDNEPEAEAWIHQVEIIRDPSHHRFLAPQAWRAMCEQSGLRVTYCEIRTKLQPDLEWYFSAAATPEPNRLQVRQLLAEVSPHVREVFKIHEAEGKLRWYWPIVHLVAEK